MVKVFDIFPDIAKEKGTDMTSSLPEVNTTANTAENGVKLPMAKLFPAGLIVLLIAATILVNSFLITFEKHAGDDTVIMTSDYCNLGDCKKRFAVPPLLILSFDGFWSSYLWQNITPEIQRLANCGVRSKFMIPIFPSKTFPNHYSIATGLYPSLHGIVDNRFYDPFLNATFKKSTTETGWYLGEPIWLTAKKAGLKSAAFFWPGSEITGRSPTYWKTYDKSIPFTERVDTGWKKFHVIKWLKLPDDERPAVIMAYFEEPDATGHNHGPKSEEVRTALLLMDAVLNYLERRLLEEGLLSCINLVLLSDHGMQQISGKKHVILSNYFKKPADHLLFHGLTARFQLNRSAVANEAEAQMIVKDIIQKLSCRGGQKFIEYNKNFIPTRFHYYGPRVGEILLKAQDEGYILSTNEDKEKYKRKGDHGYDNRFESMRTIFMAVGPDIAQNRIIDEFQNIELYNLFTHLLKIDGAPNNGTIGSLFSALRHPPPVPMTAVKQPPPECARLTTKTCNTTPNCPQICDTFLNCSQKFHSTVRASKKFTGDLCIIQLCDGVIYFNRLMKQTVLVEAVINRNLWASSIKENCMAHINGITQAKSCRLTQAKSCHTNGNESVISLFGYLDVYYMFNLTRFNVPKSFANGIWQYILREINKYLSMYEKIRYFAGVAYDHDGDGIRDNDAIVKNCDPTHFFFILIWCKNSDQIFCSQIDITTMSYILPLHDKNVNCLPDAVYLDDYTARIRDIELLTGMEFFADRNIWSGTEAVQLRTYLKMP